MRTTIKSDLSKHLPRLPRWVASWTRPFLIALAVALQNAGEYLLSLALFAAGCVSFIAAAYHWTGIEDSPRLTRFSRIGGITLAVILALAYVPWIVIRKDGHPWSNLSAVLPDMSTGKTAIVPRPALPLVPHGWDAKTPPAVAVGHRAIVPPKPSLQRTEQFLTNVMLYNDEKKIYCTGTMGPPIRQTSCGEIQNVFNGALQNTDIRSSLCVILQHYIVAIVNFAGQEWGSHGETTDAIYQEFLQPADPPDAENYAPHRLMRISDSDANLFPDRFRLEWDLPRMRLPKDTEMVLIELPSENQGPIAYGVRIERKGYYKINLTVKARQQFAAGQTPSEYNMGKVGYEGQLKTFTFLVREDWEIQRSQDPSFVVEDYDAWAHQLAKRVRTSLEK